MSEDGKAVNLDNGEEIDLGKIGLNNRIHYIERTLSPFGALLVYTMRRRWSGARVVIIGDCSDTDELPWDAPGRKDITKEAWTDFVEYAGPGMEGEHYSKQLVRDAWYAARGSPSFDAADLLDELDRRTR